MAFIYSGIEGVHGAKSVLKHASRKQGNARRVGPPRSTRRKPSLRMGAVECLCSFPTNARRTVECVVAEVSSLYLLNQALLRNVLCAGKV